MKKKITFFMIMMLIVSLCTTSTLFATDGDWTNIIAFPNLGNWSDTANWQDGIVPDGAGAIAYITNGIAQPSDGNPKGILMDSNPTLEKLYFSLDNPGVAASVILAAGTLTLAGSPIVDVASAPNFFAGYIGAQGAGFGGVLDGTDGFTKTGNGTLYLQCDSTISGTLNHNAGTIWLDWPTAAQNLDVVVNSTAILTAAYGTNNVKSITVNDGGKLETYNISSMINSPSIIIKSNGYLNIANYDNIDIRGSDITIENGGSLYCEVPQYFTVNNNFTLEGNGHHGGAIEIWNTIAYGTYNGTFTLSGNTRVFQHGMNGEMIFNGPFTGTNNASLEMIGQGADPTHTKTFYLNAQNTHNGPTTLSTFACRTYYDIGTNDCFPSDQPLEFRIYHWSQNVGMSVNMQKYTQSVPSLNIICGENTDSIGLTGEPGSKFSVVGNVNQSGGIARINTCELEIGGKLNVNGTMLGMSNVTFLSGASIGGSGTVDALTIPSGVAVVPGNSIGTLNIISNLNMEAGSSIDWEVGNPGIADLININGSFIIPSGGIAVNATDVDSPDGTYTIIKTTEGIIGDASNITMNYSTGLEGDAHPTINGNSLEVIITPEPGFIGMIILGTLALFRRK